MSEEFNLLEIFRIGSGYKGEITAKKFLWGLGITLLIAGISFGLEYLNTASIPANYVVIVGLIIALLEAAKNFAKHYKDEQLEDFEE